MTEPWVSIDDVAAHLGVRKDSIYRWIERRGLPARKIGKLWKLKVSEVDAWVRTDATGAGGPDSGGCVASDARSPNPDRYVLVVDDNEAVRATLCDFLADEGYGAIEAADGAEALGLLRSAGSPRPSLILLDLGMPRMDGWALREALQRDPQLSRIPFIVVTADRRAGLDGAIAVLRKPLDLDQLHAAIRRALGQGGR